MTGSLYAGWAASQKDALVIGLSCLTNGKFLEAHECFEDAWREAMLRPRLIFHGLAQLAASYHQLTLGRGRAAVRTWHKARAKLTEADALPPSFAAEVDAFHERLGLSVDAPRFIEVARLGNLREFPRLTKAMLHGSRP